MNYIETLRKADININLSGDNTIIAAPGVGKRIFIDFIAFIPTTSVTVQLKDGTTAYGGGLPLTQNQGVVFENSPQNNQGVITLSDNSAFVMNLSVSTQTSGFVRYRIMNE
jgi:hypothetical protein